MEGGSPYFQSFKEGIVIMKKLWPLILTVLISIQISGCSKEKPGDTQILARINDYNLTLGEFQSKMAGEIEMEKDFKLTREARDGFLDEIIRKELLIQEAKKLNLDKEEKFIRALERYWESTLIRDLMEKKGEEINKRILISQEEIEDYYDSMKETRKEIPPLSKMEEEITGELREMKKTRRLKEWIDNLRKDAKIEVNKELLYED